MLFEIKIADPGAAPGTSTINHYYFNSWVNRYNILLKCSVPHNSYIQSKIIKKSINAFDICTILVHNILYVYNC